MPKQEHSPESCLGLPTDRLNLPKDAGCAILTRLHQRGVGSMVNRWSPKPDFRVRIPAPLPSNAPFYGAFFYAARHIVNINAFQTQSNLNLPPGDFGAPLIGEIREWVADPLQFAQERAAKHGAIWKTRLLGRPCVVMLEPEGNKFIMSSGAQHFSWRDGWGTAMLRLMGGGLSLSDGEVHDQRRALLRPAFAHATLRDLTPTLAQKVRKACAAWAQRGEITLLHAFHELAFDVALTVVCGVTPSPIAHALQRDFGRFTAGLFTPVPFPIPATPYFHALFAGKRLRQQLKRLIDLRRAYPSLAGMDCLSLLLHSADGSPVADDDNIISELLLLLWAGHDTVASLLTWICLELARHPDYLARIRNEQAHVIGDDLPTADQLRNLPELDRMLRECERMHPPAPGGFRGVIEPFNYHGYDVPAGWLAMYSSVYTHNQPDLWHEPERFNPDRFEHGEGKVPFSMVGFGGGPRICIGLALAQLEMRLIVSELARAYTWDVLPDQDLRRVWLPTNQPKSGVHCRLEALG